MNFAGEQLLAASGLGYTILCAAMFMQNFLILMPRSSPMECSAPMGTGRCAFIGCSDVAAVAAAALTQDSHDGNAYLKPPASRRCPSTMRRAPVERVCPRELMSQRSCGRHAYCAPCRGVSDWQVEQMVGSAEAYAVGEVTYVVARLTGHRPRSFAAFAHEFRAAA